MSGKATTDLTQGNVAKVLLTFGVPIIAANMLQTGYHLVDMAVVGKYLGSVSLSAVSVGSDVLHLMQIASNGMSNGAQIVIAQYMGAKDRKGANTAAGSMFTFFTLFSLLLSALMIIFRGPVLSFMNTPQEAWDEAVIYTTVCYFGIVFTFGYGLIGAVLRGMGDSKHPLLFIMVSSVVNIVLDFVFVAGMGMGCLGAALATVVGQGVSFIWALSFLYRIRQSIGFDFTLSTFKIDRVFLPRFLRIAIPLFLQNSLIQLGTLYVNSFIYAYGVTITAVTGIGTKLGTVGHIFNNAMIRAGSAMVGQSIAAGKEDRVKKVIYVNAVAGFAAGTLLSLVTIIFRLQIFGLFTDDIAVLNMSEVYLPVLILQYYAFSTRGPSMALINGIGMPKINYTLGIVEGLVCRVGISLLLGIVFDLGVYGFWYGIVIGGYSAFIVGSIYFFSGKWKDVTLISGPGKTKNH